MVDMTCHSSLICLWWVSVILSVSAMVILLFSAAKIVSPTIGVGVMCAMNSSTSDKYCIGDCVSRLV